MPSQRNSDDIAEGTSGVAHAGGSMAAAASGDATIAGPILPASHHPMPWAGHSHADGSDTAASTCERRMQLNTSFAAAWAGGTPPSAVPHRGSLLATPPRAVTPARAAAAAGRGHNADLLAQTPLTQAANSRGGAASGTPAPATCSSCAHLVGQMEQGRLALAVRWRLAGSRPQHDRMTPGLCMLPTSPCRWRSSNGPCSPVIWLQWRRRCTNCSMTTSWWWPRWRRARQPRRAYTSWSWQVRRRGHSGVLSAPRAIAAVDGPPRAPTRSRAPGVAAASCAAG